jgi:16S rRNA (guanine966-N2)-methyltransferase
MLSKTQLRIIAGSLKGRRLNGPDWPDVRPTSDRLRETLFNVLGETVRSARVLDGFAGTGAVGIEALSRGAAHVTFVDDDPRALALVRQNLGRCGVTDGYTILRADLAAAGSDALPAKYDLAFLDPPYALDPDAVVAAMSGAVADGGRLVLEHARRSTPPARSGALVLTRVIKAGDSTLSLYRRAVDLTEPA